MKQFAMDEFKYLTAWENGEAIERRSRKEGDATKSKDNDAEVVDVARAGGASVDVEMETVLDSTEIQEIENRIAGGLENRSRSNTDDVKVSRRPSLGTALYTSASIKFVSTITKWDRSVFWASRNHLEMHWQK